MSILSIRLSQQLDAHLNEESQLAGQPKSLLVREALAQYLVTRRNERFLSRLTQAASSLHESDAAALAEEALPFDNEALALTEGGNAPNDRLGPVSGV